jgi:hypothetical protein
MVDSYLLARLRRVMGHAVPEIVDCLIRLRLTLKE